MGSEEMQFEWAEQEQEQEQEETGDEDFVQEMEEFSEEEEDDDASRGSGESLDSVEECIAWEEEFGIEFDLSALQMKIGADKQARALAKPILKATFPVIVDEFEDPNGYFTNQLVPRTLPNTESGIYHVAPATNNGALEANRSADEATHANQAEETDADHIEATDSNEAEITDTEETDADQRDGELDSFVKQVYSAGKQGSQGTTANANVHHIAMSNPGSVPMNQESVPMNQEFAVRTRSKKYGSAMKMKKREEDYGVGVDFKPVLAFDRMKDETDAGLQPQYGQFMEILKTHPSLHPFQRALFTQIRDHQGECFVKRKIVIQMIESAIQLAQGYPSPQEFLMFEMTVYEKIFLMTARFGNAILDVIPVELKGIGMHLFLWAIMSWATGYTNTPTALSSNVETTKFLVGDNCADTLPIPVFENPTNSQEAFSTDFSRSARAHGRCRFHKMMANLFRHEMGVLLLDTNKLIFIFDPDYEGTVEEALHRLDFKSILTLPYKEVVVYIHKGRKHVVLLHRPLCGASDSRSFVSQERRSLRGLTVAILGYVLRVLQGKRLFTRDDMYENPIHAMVAFQIMRDGHHVSNMVCSAFYRRFICKPSINPLVQNNISKGGAALDFPITKRLRRIRNKSDCGRPLHYKLGVDARSIISKASSNSEDQVQQMKESLHKLFATSKSGKPVDSSGLSKRWNALIAQCVPDTELHSVILEIRDAQNAGNRDSGEGKAPRNTDITENDDFMEELLLDHDLAQDEQPGEPFWVSEKRIKDKANTSPPVQGSKSVCGLITFPNGAPVYKNLAFNGIKTRCESKPSKRKVKGKTSHVKSKKYPHLTLKRCLSPKDNNSGIKVWNQDKSHAYLLVSFRKMVSQDQAQVQVQLHGKKRKSVQG